jgi:hypothetical protein
MPRKKVRRLSPKETESDLDRLMAPTQLAWQEREQLIRRMCKHHGADPDNQLDRHKMFGLLVYLAPRRLRPDDSKAHNAKRGRPKKQRYPLQILM